LATARALHSDPAVRDDGGGGSQGEAAMGGRGHGGGRLRPAERRRVPDGGGECGVAPGARASEESADVDTFNITLYFITLMAH